MRAAFYECDVTPPLGGFLWGHYNNVTAQTVKDRLYIKSVVVEDGGEYAAIVVIDSCSLIPGIHDIVASRVAQYTPIPKDRVCISSNHTHSGAPIHSDPSCDGKADEAYTDVFLRLCADCITLAWQRLCDADVKYAYSQVDSISFNRNYVKDDGTIITHGRGKEGVIRTLDGIDSDLPVLFFESDGKPIGAIINFACHQCCLGKYDGYSGDYSSYLSKHLKEKYGQEFVSLFVLGACGDINHVNPDKNIPIPTDHYKHMGKLLADSVIASLGKAEPVKGTVRMIGETVALPRRPVNKDEVKQKVEKWIAKNDRMRARNILHYQVSCGDITEDTMPVQAIAIGDVMLYTLPGEIYNRIGKEIKSGSPSTRNMVIENCNEYCGYIPTEQAFAECSDLYEISLCGHSRHIPTAGNILRDKALELAAKI